MQIIEIDGSIGGGQVLRTAVSLASLTLKPIRITNIRKNRPNPGLRPQHLAGVKTSGKICNADIKGLSIGSTEIEFIPKSHNFSDIKVDIGTAGSTQLFLQSLIPVLMFSDKPITIKVKGGTAGLGAPTAEYLKFVTLPILEKMTDGKIEFEILRQGFYPKGGGIVEMKMHPTKQLKSIKASQCGKIKKIHGFSIVGKLPESVIERQTNSVKKIFEENDFQADIESIQVNSVSPGTSVTVIAQCENTVLGSDEIGQIGKRAEKVGSDAAKGLITSITAEKAFDRYMSDQIIPFISLAEGTSEITVEEITNHLRSNITVTEKILGVDFDIDEKENKVSVKGLGFKNEK